MIGLTVVDSPVGALTVAAHDERVCAVWFGSREEAAAVVSRWSPPDAVSAAADPAGAVTALSAYFAGTLDALEHVPVELNGTPFQQRVWTRLRDVRPGTTASYRDIAVAIGA